MKRVTDEVFIELGRCAERMKQYRDGPLLNPNPYHAAARRASLDLSKVLARWRRTWIVSGGVK